MKILLLRNYYETYIEIYIEIGRDWERVYGLRRLHGKGKAMRTNFVLPIYVGVIKTASLLGIQG